MLRGTGSYLRGLWVRLNGGQPPGGLAEVLAGLELPLPADTKEQSELVGLSRSLSFFRFQDYRENVRTWARGQRSAVKRSTIGVSSVLGTSASRTCGSMGTRCSVCLASIFSLPLPLTSQAHEHLHYATSLDGLFLYLPRRPSAS